MDDILKVKFNHSNTVRGAKPYTIYEIEVRSSSTITWVIYKRYNSFVELHQQLVNMINEHPSRTNIKLPTLPPKRLTRSLATEFVEKRKLELEEYLRNCLAIPSVLHSDEMLTFLEAPESVRPMLVRNSALNATSGDAKGIRPAVDVGHLSNKSTEERSVLELIAQLKSNPNKVAAIRQFESYFFSNRPRLSSEFIRILLEGKPGTEHDVGLIQTCGDFRHSRVASRAALFLIHRLIDPERNRDAHLYVEQLVYFPPTVLQKLRLHMHILSSRGNRPVAFGVVYLLQQYIELRMSSSSSSSNHELTLESIVQDSWSRQHYLRWLRLRAFNSRQVNQDDTEADSLTVVLKSDLVQCKQLTQTGFQKLLHSCSRESGWKNVHVADYDDQPPSTAYRTTRNGAGGGELTGSGHAEGDARGGVGTMAPPPRPQPLNISLSYLRDADNDLFLIRSCVLLPFRVQEISSILTMVNLQSSWNTKIHASGIVHRWDDTTDIIHTIFRTTASQYRHKDVCFLRSVTQLHDGSVVILMRSVQSQSCLEVKEYSRVTIHPSGYIISPLNQNESLLTLLLHLDRDSVLLYAQDLLGEASDIRDSWYNLYNLLSEQRAASVALNQNYGSG